MKKLLAKIRTPLLFVLAMLPAAIIGGYFTGVYGWTELTEDLKMQVMDQIGNNLQLYYLITTMQTVMYTVVLGFIGYLISDKLGLMRPLMFEKKKVLIALGSALFAGLILSTDILFFRKSIPQVAAIYQRRPSFVYWMSSILYGGVVEEIMLRLFVMSLLAFLGWKLFFKKEEKVPVMILIGVNFISAVLFAAGHLPATLQMFGEITPMMLIRCFLLNGAGGLIFGHLYRKHGIQYSMMAHAGAHVVWKLIWIVLL